MTVSRSQRFTRSRPCPICGGGDSAPRGKGRRCWGYLSDDGAWAHCSREEYAGGLPLHQGSQTYAHRLTGDCRCGLRHDAATDGTTPDRPADDPVVATFEYQDENRRTLFRVVRTARKRFWQQRPDGAGGWRNGIGGVRRALYRLPELLAAAPDMPVYIPEGEKHVDALLASGLVATCNPGGAGKWRDEYAEALHGRHVVVLPDNDPPGRAHASAVAGSLRRVAATVRVLELPGLPPKGDVLDWLRAGSTVTELDRLAEATSDGPVVVRLETVAPRRVEWLWEQRFARGKLGLVGGDPGLGKSYALLSMAACVSRGAPWPDGRPAPCGRVVILTAEDGLDDTIVPRLAGLGADLSQIVALPAIREQGRERVVSLATDLRHLEAVVTRVKPLLLLIDPLSAYLGDTDPHKDAEVRSALVPIVKLAGEQQVAIVALLHLNKAMHLRALYRIGGSIAFTAAARSVFAVVSDGTSDTRRLFVPLKANLAPLAPALAFTVTSAGLAWDPRPVPRVDVEAALRGPGEVETLETRHAVADAELLLQALLADGAKSYAEVAEARRAAGLSERTLYRAKARLGIRSVRNGFGKGATYAWQLAPAATMDGQAAPGTSHLAVHEEPAAGSPESAQTSPWTASAGGTGASGRPCEGEREVVDL